MTIQRPRKWTFHEQYIVLVPKYFIQLLLSFEKYYFELRAKKNPVSQQKPTIKKKHSYIISIYPLGNLFVWRTWCARVIVMRLRREYLFSTRFVRPRIANRYDRYAALIWSFRLQIPHESITALPLDSLIFCEQVDKGPGAWDSEVYKFKEKSVL